MKLKDKLFRKVSKEIINVSEKLVIRTVGKSCPLWLHEVEIPNEVKALCGDKQTN